MPWETAHGNSASAVRTLATEEVAQLEGELAKLNADIAKLEEAFERDGFPHQSKSLMYLYEIRGKTRARLQQLRCAKSAAR